MGGKKGPEKNRKYEKDRRDRFNNQFVELSKLLPDFNSSVIKVTKAEIIGRTIQCLQDTQLKNKKLENDFELGKNKIDELQKRVTGLLQIIKELIELLHKSDVNFPTSLPLDDFVSFKEAYLKCKRKSKEDDGNDSNKKKKVNSVQETFESKLSDHDTSDHEIPKTEECSTVAYSSSIPNTLPSNSTQTVTSSGDNVISTICSLSVPRDPPKSITTTVTNLETPNVLRLDTNSLLVPSANILTVNGLQNPVINPINNPQTLVVNKQITVPTFILMQNNNLIPVSSLQTVTPQQRSQKLIVPKQSIISTKTTFINKKPIPAVCLYKSTTPEKDDTLTKVNDSFIVKKRKSKRSKGILVKYPKRKPPSKKKSTKNHKQKPEAKKPSVDSPASKSFTSLKSCDSTEKTNSNGNDTFSMENCYSINETNFNENNHINKNYSCSDSIFDSTDGQNNSEFGSKNVQFIDFFENSARSVENNNENVHSIETFVNNTDTGCDKIEKSVQNQNLLDISFKSTDNFNEHLNDICNGNFPNENINCNSLETTSKESNLENNREKNNSGCVNKTTNHGKNSTTAYHLPTSCGVSNDSLLMKFVPNDPTSNHECNKTYSQPVTMGNKNTHETELSKRKHSDKDITPLTIQCNISENKSISKELSLSLIDEKKHYDNVSSFDEFSNDLFTSLQVPSSCQNTDSISPTAAFLLTFPLVSSCKNADLLPEHEHEEDNGNTTVTTSATILQIGNLESPPTLLFTSSKFATRDNQKSVNSCSKSDDTVYSSTFCNNPISNVLVSNDLSSNDSTVRKEKSKDKENELGKQYMPIGRSDGYNFNDVSFSQKNTCSKDLTGVSQNIPFYTPSCSSSSFPSYNIFTKYNDIPPVTAPYYSLGSQPFPVSKSVTTDPIADFNSWVTVPSVYQDIDSSKDKKRDKCTSTNMYKNKSNDFSANISTFGLSLNDLNSQPERTKVDKMKKPSKQNNTRLVNWMTSPDLRNPADNSQSHDNFMLQKDDAIGTNSFLNSSSIGNVQNNTFGNVSYSSSDYFLDNQNYVESQNLNNCKVTYSSSNPASYSWSPSKSALPTLPHLDAHNMIIPSTLPTLVGDLALGNSSTAGPMEKIFNNYDILPKKYVEADKPTKRDACKNFYKNDRIVQNEYTKTNPQGSFLSVTQLVDDKDRLADEKFPSKTLAKSIKLGINVDESCHFENELNRDKCYVRGKENYGNIVKHNETEFPAKKIYNTNASCSANTSKTEVNVEMKTNQIIKCKSKDLKYNVNRCLAKENKKDTRSVNQQKPYDYVPPNNSAGCDMLNKGVNPLSNKNSNYSAESLISSSNHQNSCSTQNYFPYDNTNYSSCSSSNDYSKRANETESLSGYYTNTNYVYPNNFQSFNNYGFSNQCYNNYPSQLQHTSLPKKSQKEDNFNKQDTDWYKDSFSSPHYNPIVSSDFTNQNKTEKCKQSFTNNKYNDQKNSTNSNMHNSKYYNYNASVLVNNSKSSCNFNASYAFSQTTQQCTDTGCLAPNYEMKSNRNTAVVNSNNVHSASSLTNFNLSAIFPEINDKHCNQNQVNDIGNEKKDANFSNNKIIDDMNYNYLIQPSTENNPEAVSVYGSSSFQIQHFTDFGTRKSQK